MIGKRSNDIFEHVFSGDDALDLTHPDCNPEKYRDTLDRKHLPIKEGRIPTVFKIRPLSRLRFMAISSMPEADRANACVAFGVVGIDNWRIPKTGNTLIPEFIGVGADQHLAPATLDAIFAPGLFAELMNIIMHASGLDPLADRPSA